MLPLEIITNILSYLDDKNNIKTLRQGYLDLLRKEK